MAVSLSEFSIQPSLRKEFLIFLIYSYIIEELIHQSLLMVKFPLIKFKARIAPFEVLEVNAHEWQSQKQ